MEHSAFYFGIILNETERLMGVPDAPGMKGIGETYGVFVAEHNLLESPWPTLGEYCRTRHGRRWPAWAGAPAWAGSS